MMLMKEEDYIAHYGTPRKSGRYPYGSGEESKQRGRSLLDTVEELRKQGLSNTEIAKGLNMSTTKLIALKSIAKNEEKQRDIDMAQRLKAKAYSNGEIGKRMAVNGKPRNESSIRALLAAGEKDNRNILQVTADFLQNEVDTKGWIDVSKGVENWRGISKERLGTAVLILQDKGYVMHPVQQPQIGSPNKTTQKVLAPPGTTYREIVMNPEKITQITGIFKDHGRTPPLNIMPPISVNSKRIAVKYAEDGGNEADGVIHVRPGAKNLSLGKGNYAQVRIMVDNTHYLKGMAMYKDDLPAGTDLVFNTAKSKKELGSDKLAAMKDLKRDKKTGEVDQINPFGSMVDQLFKVDAKGDKHLTSAMNLVNEEGDWDKWSRNLSSQTLSKQSPKLAKSQLDMTFEKKKNDLDEIMKLTNPAVRKKLLETYATEADSSAVHLKAAALPRSNWQVLLPMNSLKVNEIYAPNYNTGELVALIRYPHGGTFEIPELIVNNNHQKAKKVLGLAQDAVAINYKVAKRLSGADFDGDAVLVVPNERRLLKTTPALERLKDFDPQAAFPGYPGMTPMSAHTKGTQMGIVSNLITDMTIRKASTDKLARAIRHSMVVIDAEKHDLNYKESARVNGINQLKAEYQISAKGGASTLISRRKARWDGPKYKLQKQSMGAPPSGPGPVNRVTGELVKIPTGESYVVRKPRTKAHGGPIDLATGKRIYEPLTGNEKVKINTIGSMKLLETTNAHTLSSGTPMETVYANHSNKLKDLANQARLAAVHTKTTPHNKSATKAYKKEVDSLNAKLNVALKNAPLERQALVIANAMYASRLADNPTMEKAEKKKLKFMAQEAARSNTGAFKQQIRIENAEWDAIQAGAITNFKLTEILRNADLDRVKELATPRDVLLMTSTKQRRAQAMLASGYTQAEVASHLGVSLTTLKTSLV